MPTIVRLASGSDMDSLLALNAEVQALHAELHPEDFRPKADVEGARAMFAAQLGRPDAEIAIAEVDGAAAGHVLFEILALAESAFNPPRRRADVHHLCVTKSMRRQGVATGLVRFVEQRGAEEGVAELALDVWTANAGAAKFFESLGFAPFKVVMRKRSPVG